MRAAINALHLSDTQRSKLFIALNTGAYDPETIIQAAITLAQLGPKSRVKVDNILRDVKKQTESKVREEQDVNDEEETIIPDDDDTLETDKANYKRDTSIPFTTFGTLESILQTYKENPEYGINITEHQKAELLARDSVYTQNEMTLYDLLNLLDVLSKNKDLTVQDAEKQLDFNFDDVQDKQNMEAEAQERTEQTVKHDEEINAEQKTPTSNTGNTGTNSEVGTNPETTARPSAGGDIEGTAESSGTNESTGTGRSELSEQRPLESPETSSTTTGNDTAEVKEQNGDNGGQPTDRSKATNTGTGSTDGQPDRSNGNDGNGADVSKGANGLNEIPVGSDTSTPKERYEADVRGNDKFLLEAKLAYTYFGKSSGKKTEQKMPFGTYTSEDGKSLITPNGTTFTYDNMNSSIKVKYANGTIDPFQIPTRNKTAFENLIASYKGEKKNTVEIKNENNEPAPTIASTDNKFGIPEDDIKSVDIVEVQGKADDDIVFTSQLTLKDGTKLPISIEKTDSDTADIGATVLINGIRQRTNNAGKSVQTPISKVINFKNVTAAEDYIRRFASKIKGEKDVAPQEAFNKNPEQFVKKHLLSDYIEAATVPIENISRGYTIKFKGIAEPVNFEYNNNNISFTVKDVKYTLYKNIDGQGAYNFVKDLVKSINYNAARSSFGNGYYSAGRLLSLDWSKDGGRELYESVGGTTDATDDVMAVRANLKGIVNEFLTKADRQTVETALQGRLDDIIDRAESLNDLNSIKSAIISALPLKSKENFIKESSLHSISKENIEELIDTILDKNGDAYMNHTGFGSSKIVQKSVRALVNEYRQLKKNYPDTVKEVLQEANSDTQDVAKAVSEYEQGLLNKGEDFIRDLEEAGITLPDGYDLADETRMQKVAGTNKADRKNFEVVIKKDDGTDERVHIYVGTRNGKYVLEQQGTDNKWHTREEFDAGTATPKEPLIVNNREFPSESKPKQKIQAFNRKVFSFALPFGHPIKQRGTLTRKVAQDFIDRFSSSLHWADNAHPEWKQEFYLFKNAEEARKNGFPRAYDDAYGMYFYGENGRPGRVVLYLDNISSLEQLAGVLAHETIVHGGLDRLVGKEHLQDMLIASYKTWTPREKELFKKWLEDPENPYVPENASLFDTMNSQVKATLLEEFIAANYSKFRENGTLGGLGRAAYNLRKGFIYRVYDFLKNLLRKLLGISEKESPDLFDARTATGIIRSLERAATEGPGWDKAPVARTGFSLIEDVFDGLSIGYIPSKLEARGANKILSATSGMDRTGLLDKLRAPFSAELDPDFVADMAHTGIEITSNTIKEIKETADLAHAFGYDNVEDFAQRLNIAYQDFGDQSLGREGRAAFLRDVRNPEKRFLWESTIRDVYEGRDTNFGDSVERATIASMFDENFLSEIIRYDTETAAPKASKISKKKIQKLAEEITEADEEKLTGTAKDLWDNTQVRNNSWWLAATTKVAGTFKNITAYADQWFATYFDDPTKSLSRNPLISKLNLMPARTQGVINELAPHLQTIKQSMVETAHRLGRDINDVLTTAGKYATARHAEEANAYLLKNYSDQIADLEKIIKDKKIDPFAQEHKPREQKILDARDRLYIERKRLMDNLETIRDPKNEEHKELMQMRTGTGLTNAEARSIMQEILNSGYTREELDAFSDKLSGFLGSEVLGLAKKHGVVSDDIELPDFKHYVPATSINPESFVADNDATPIFNAGKLYARQGRITVADDGWTATNEAVKRIAKQIGSADFTDALIGAFKVQAKRYATDDPRRGLIATKYADKFGRVLHGDSMDKYRAMKFLEKGGFVCTDKETGDRLVIRFKESGWIDPITGLSGELLNESLCSTPRMDNAFGKAMTGITGGFGQILTRFKPLFAPANMTRDMFERSFAMATDSYTLDNGTVVNGPINAAKFLYNMTTGRIGKMFFDALMGRDNPTAKQYYEEYRNLGGKQDLSTLGIIERPDILNTGSTKPEAVQKLLNKVRVQCPGLYKILGEATPDVAAKALNMLDHWNDYFNSMGGFGQYVTLREAGLTPKAATNATLEFMNLNQTGAATPVLRCLYPFVKPTVQGAANLMRNLGFAYDPRGFFHAARAKSYGYMLGMLAAGSVIKSLVEETLGEDENGNKKIDAMSLDQLASFIPMPIGDNNYFRLNVGFGMPQVVFTTLYGLDRVSRGIMEPGDLAARLALTTVKNVAPGNWPQFNPSENPTAFILQTFAPTFMRPFIESATNTTFTGNTLVYPSADRGKSKAYSGGARAAKVYHNMAQTIFDYTGLDMAPEQVQNIMTNLFVGPFALLRSALEANDPGKTSTNLYKDTHMDPLLYAIGASMHAGKMPNTDMQLFYMQNDRYNKLLRDNHINLSEHPSGLSGSDLTDWQRKVLEETGLDDKDISNILILNAARRSLNGKTKDVNKLLRAGILSQEDNDRLIELFQQLDDFKQSVYASALEALE